MPPFIRYSFLFFLLWSLSVNALTNTTSPTTSAPSTSTPTRSPTTAKPTTAPTKSPTAQPTPKPTNATSNPSTGPSISPATTKPTPHPSTTRSPSASPATTMPTHAPTTELPCLMKFIIQTYSNKAECHRLGEFLLANHSRATTSSEWNASLADAFNNSKSAFCSCPLIRTLNKNCPYPGTESSCAGVSITTDTSPTKINIEYFIIIGVLICCVGGVIIYWLKKRDSGDQALLNGKSSAGNVYNRQSKFSGDSGSDTDENLMMNPPRRTMGSEVVSTVTDAIDSLVSRVPKRTKKRKPVVVRPPTGAYSAASQTAGDGATELQSITVQQEPQFALGDSDDDDDETTEESDEELKAIRERQRAKKKERELKSGKRKGNGKSSKSKEKRRKKSAAEDFDPRGGGDDEVFLSFAPDCDE